jgi:sugar O-acyltransferase (sialic acid O-acetyltransferase NeuD family)|tara:strand:+ start:103 stop:753 length:651 start_codon:yes stop_codon:yes gene_type:complete
VKKKIIIFTAGSAGRETFKLIKEISLLSKNKWEVLGYIDSSKRLNGKILDGVKIYSNCKKFKSKDIFAICGITDPLKRKEIYKNEIIKNKFKIPNLIHPKNIIPKDLKIGFGNIIFNHVHLSFEVSIKNCSLISNFTDLGHNSIVNDFVSIMPQTSIGGNCKIGNNTFIGSGSNVHQNTNIGKNCKIGMGSIIINEIKDNHSVINFQRQVIQKINK